MSLLPLPFTVHFVPFTLALLSQFRQYPRLPLIEVEWISINSINFNSIQRERKKGGVFRIASIRHCSFIFSSFRSSCLHFVTYSSLIRQFSPFIHYLSFNLTSVQSLTVPSFVGLTSVIRHLRSSFIRYIHSSISLNSFQYLHIASLGQSMYIHSIQLPFHSVIHYVHLLVSLQL